MACTELICDHRQESRRQGRRRKPTQRGWNAGRKAQCADSAGTQAHCKRLFDERTRTGHEHSKHHRVDLPGELRTGAARFRRNDAHPPKSHHRECDNTHLHNIAEKQRAAQISGAGPGQHDSEQHDHDCRNQPGKQAAAEHLPT